MMRILVVFCFAWIVWFSCVRTSPPPASAMGAMQAMPVMAGPPGLHVDVDFSGNNNLFSHEGGSQSCGAGSVCNFDCPDGHCDFLCEAGSVCNASCEGGHCEMSCGTGAVCNQACDGGHCQTSCEPGSTCNVTCDGGHCDGSCSAGAICAGKCDGGHCGEGAD